MNRSRQRGTFHSQCRIEDAVAEGQDPDKDEDVQRALELERMINEAKAQREADERWKKNNLEYDLRSTEWICDKAKASEAYAQNIYITNDEEIEDGDWVLIIDDFETYIHEHKGDNLPTVPLTLSYGVQNASAVSRVLSINYIHSQGEF